MRKLLSFAVGLLMAILIIAPLLAHKVVKCDTMIIYELFKDKFKDPIEVCYLILADYTMYRLTSHDETKITFSFFELKRELKRRGHKISDIMIIIHNHEPGTSRKFSNRDIQTWYDFKAEGFVGNYYLLYEGNGVIYELIEDEDDSR